MGQPENIIVSAFCQTGGIGAALQAIFPRARIRFVPIVNEQTVTARRLARLLKRCDAWVHCESDEAAHVSAAARAASGLAYLRVPLIEFRAFHPDMCLAYDSKSDAYSRQKYSSAIGVWAYHRRLPPDVAARYFNGRVFESLGYFDCWHESTETLRDAFERSDLGDSFSVFYRRIKRAGQFMHTATHPTPLPLTTLAKLISTKLGAPASVMDRQMILEDYLAYLRWPVYPEIARRLSIPTTGYVWKMKQSTLEDDVTLGGAEAFLEYCYHHYRKQGITPENIRIRGIDLEALEERIMA